jgi:hypothetical protein
MRLKGLLQGYLDPFYIYCEVYVEEHGHAEVRSTFRTQEADNKL